MRCTKTVPTDRLEKMDDWLPDGKSIARIEVNGVHFPDSKSIKTYLNWFFVPATLHRNCGNNYRANDCHHPPPFFQLDLTWYFRICSFIHCLSMSLCIGIELLLIKQKPACLVVWIRCRVEKSEKKPKNTWERSRKQLMTRVSSTGSKAKDWKEYPCKTKL